MDEILKKKLAEELSAHALSDDDLEKVAGGSVCTGFPGCNGGKNCPLPGVRSGMYYPLIWCDVDGKPNK